VGALIETELKVGSPAELAEHYYPNGRLGGLSIEGKSPGALGQLVLLKVDVVRPARQFVLRGQLAWVRHKSGGPNQPTGFGVDFLPEDDATRVRLLAFARQEVHSDATRVEQRQQVELKVRVVHEGKQRKELVADLSTGGAFIRSWDPLPVGSKLQLALRLPLTLSALELKGQVAWVRRAGEHPGMGIVFEHEGEVGKQKLEKLLSKLSR
jgi:uncharacterized protein (TIGR02266 family)